MNLISKLFLVFYVSFFNYLYSDHGERKTQLLSTYETGLFDEGAAVIKELIMIFKRIIWLYFIFSSVVNDNFYWFL